MQDGSKLKEECGVFGAYSLKDAVQYEIYFGLQALQHRGQESSGIAVLQDRKVNCIKGMGLVTNVFTEENLELLESNIGIGHVRYSTAGESNLSNAQPLFMNSGGTCIALAHNGNLVNAEELKSRLENEGIMFETSSDTEIILYLIVKNYERGLVEAIKETMKIIKGSYSLVLLMDNKLIGVRDLNGIRPLCLGKKEDTWYLASESCALDVIGAELIRDVEPGEIVIIDEEGLKTVKEESSTKKAICAFEYIYFARPDSVIDGKNVYLSRLEMGKRFALEAPADADLVVYVPDSGMASAEGYSEQIGIPIREGLIRSKYVGRTFIYPEQKEREIGVKIKLNVLKCLIRNKRVVLVDDSIVRGTTMGRIVNLLREGGAKEVHVRISSPPVRNPCYFGIDIPDRKELVAAKLSIEEIRRLIGADSLSFLSVEGLKKAIGSESVCTGCFDGAYPMDITNIGGGNEI
jgi:amidophosphoribosyltransferase